ncbi:putative membrane protein [Streptococcus parauberis NCFD 2020]|uniref:Putative membrane protein n=1 Tax=Streptococcus parauberis NCFD 2020 TaxID=873447 RepID=F1YX48_9STRE|nr:putative membrane protein [Streptococcus parauberis NCFD 2020]
MKLSKILYNISKLILSWTICFILLTYYNEFNILDLKELVTNQLISPFPSENEQQLSFIKLIMILGFSFVSFLSTYKMMAEISVDMKMMIKSHCKNERCYQISIMKIIINIFVKEFLWQALFILYFLSIKYQSIVVVVDVLCLLFVWFLVDSITYFLITYFCSDSVLTIVLISIEIIFRIFFINHITYLLMIFCLFYCFVAIRRLKCVRNKKWIHN